MAFSYTWNDAITLVNSYLKQVPGFSPVHCDMVYSEFYDAYPWHWTITNIPTTGEAGATTGYIPLVDGVQDYNAPPQIYRLLTAKFNRTDVSPRQVQELDVKDFLSIDLAPRSYRNISCASLQRSVGLIRLEAAVQVPSGVGLEFGGDYQLEPAKVTAFSQFIAAPDRYLRVFMAGLLYWGFLLTDQPQQAGGVTTDAEGREQATGQYGVFRAAIKWAMRAEDFGGDETMFPGEPMGIGRDPGGLNIFGNPS